jgi:hypothetical protein
MEGYPGHRWTAGHSRCWSGGVVTDVSPMGATGSNHLLVHFAMSRDGLDRRQWSNALARPGDPRGRRRVVPGGRWSSRGGRRRRRGAAVVAVDDHPRPKAGPIRSVCLAASPRSRSVKTVPPASSTASSKTYSPSCCYTTNTTNRRWSTTRATGTGDLHPGTRSGTGATGTRPRTAGETVGNDQHSRTRYAHAGRAY